MNGRLFHTDNSSISEWYYRYIDIFLKHIIYVSLLSSLGLILLVFKEWIFASKNKCFFHQFSPHLFHFHQNLYHHFLVKDRSSRNVVPIVYTSTNLWNSTDENRREIFNLHNSLTQNFPAHFLFPSHFHFHFRTWSTFNRRKKKTKDNVLLIKKMKDFFFVATLLNTRYLSVCLSFSSFFLWPSN